MVNIEEKTLRRQFKIIHALGLKKRAADAISRRHTLLLHRVSVSGISAKDIKDMDTV